jgi:hypothetical protein
MKLDMFCCFTKQNMFQPFFLTEFTYTGMRYQTLEYLFIPILEEEGPNDILFQQNRMPRHFHKVVMTLLNRKIA